MILIDGKKAAAELRNELKNEVAELKSKYNEVPGGVGPMTIACLLKNTIECFKRSKSNKI